MDWLKDKKNLPIVAGLGVVVFLLALVAILYETGVIGGASAQQAGAPAQPLSPPGMAATATPPPSVPGMPPPGMYPGGPPSTMGAPAASGVPVGAGAAVAAGGSAGAATAAKPTVGQPAVNVAKGPDPFNAPRPKVASRLTPRITKPQVRQVVPFVSIARLTPPEAPGVGTNQSPLPQILLTPEESATMRVSGVVQTSTGVHAVLEANGRSLPVQPGDTIPGGRVVSIQSDGLILRTSDDRTVHVPLGSVPTGGQGGGYPGQGGGYPGQGGGYPGQGGGYPGQGGGYPGAGGYNG